jgi:cell division protein FtsQ
MFALLAAFFFALDRAYLFLISWDRLTVRTIELHCGRESVSRTLKAFLQTRPLGNILLCDISALQRQLESYPWVRDARVEKVFPATLKIEILEREPFVLIEKNGLAVVDVEGTVLEPSVSSEAWPGLPVVRDENGFRDGFWEKWETARACVEALTAPERVRLLALECSDDGRITLQFKEDTARIILDRSAVREKLDRFAACRAEIESRFGPLDYADLRLDDRIVVRPQEPTAANPTPKSQKETE